MAQTKGLADKAMLVSLTISQWVLIIMDKPATKKFTVDNSVSTGACTVRKRLLPKKGAVIELQAAVSALRKYHGQMTLPWTKGIGILASSKYTEYSSKMRELITAFKTAKSHLITEYPNLKDEAKLDLNTLWQDKEYPAASDFDRRFDVSIDVMPIPQKGDWRIDLVDEELEKLDDELEKREGERIGKANQELWKRLYEPVKHMVEVLQKDKPRIFKTLISNILDLTSILPDLNLAEDSKLEKLRREVEDELCDLSVTELKESPFLRDKIAEKAEELRKKIKEDGGIMDGDVVSGNSADDGVADDGVADDGVADDGVAEFMSGYTGSKYKDNKVITEFGEPVVGQKKIKGV